MTPQVGLTSVLPTERHVSIQTKLEDLEMLVDLTGGELRRLLHVGLSGAAEPSLGFSLF